MPYYNGLATISLVYIGQNPDNISGWSAKFWRLDPVRGSGDLRATWGKIGTAGQSKVYTADEGRQKVNEKLRKGYVYADRDDTVVPVQPAQPLSLEQRIAALTFRPYTMERLIHFIASRALVEVTTVAGCRLFVDSGGARFAVRAAGSGYELAAV